MRGWYVVETQQASELRALTNVARQGFVCFNPLMRRSIRRHGKILASMVPVFPRYFFVELDLDADAWRSINGSYGVKRLVRMTGVRPAKVPDGVVEALRERCVDGVLPDTKPEWSVGQSVRVAAGPFCDAVAVIERFESRDRVRILMEMLSGFAPVSLPLSALEAL